MTTRRSSTFWSLVQQGGLSQTEAHKRLKGTFSKDKNEILFTEFGLNYNTVEEVFKRGTILIRMSGGTSKKDEKKQKKKEEKMALKDKEARAEKPTQAESTLAA